MSAERTELARDILTMARKHGAEFDGPMLISHFGMRVSMSEAYATCREMVKEGLLLNKGTAYTAVYGSRRMVLRWEVTEAGIDWYNKMAVA